MELQIFKNGRRDYIVKRVGGEVEQHAHLSDYKGCKQVVRLIRCNRLPKNKWLQGACKRLLTEAEYDKLERGKPMYYNNPYGAKKKKDRVRGT